MATEFKSLDISVDQEEKIIQAFQSFGWRCIGSQRIFNQTTTPTAAISYESYTYVHSETETVDFVRLTFERDKKMPNYEEIVELEDEFWSLNSTINYEKPYLPPNANTMEDWARIYEPDLREKGIKTRIHIIFGILAFLPVVILQALAGSIDSFDNSDEVGPAIMLIYMIVMIIIWVNSIKGYKKTALNTALKNQPSIYRTKLETMYNDIVDAVNYYDQTVDRMREIINEAEDLLEI